MPIPKEILEVKRPRNTIVIAYGKNKDRYAVRERIGCKYKHGRRIPVNGPTIGHIVGGKYVPRLSGTDPLTLTVSMAPVDIKDWGAVVLCDNVAHALLDELCTVYNSERRAEALLRLHPARLQSWY